MTRCIVMKCSEIGVHHIPKDKNIRRLWLKAIRRENLVPTNSSRLCRKHFVESDYEKISKYTGVENQHKYLKKGTVPSVFAWNTQLDSEVMKARQARLKARNLKKKQPFEMPSTSQYCQEIDSDDGVQVDCNVSEELVVKNESSKSPLSSVAMAEESVINSKNQILELLSQLNVNEIQLIEKWICSGSYKEDLQKLKSLQDLEKPLKKIVTTLKTIVPFKAEMPTETIRPPEVGDQADCNEVNTVHIDEFIYDEKEVDKLVEKGKLKKYYCKDCGSHNSEELIFTSHSMSRKALQYIFKVLLPANLMGKQILDVGSRLGAVLYGAYYFSNASKIIGVEINKEFCDIQEKIITQFSMDKNRILVEHADITKVENLIKTTDILIVNVLDFFVDVQKHIEIWQFLRNHLKKGTHLIANRSMVDTFSCLNIFEEFVDWLNICKPYQLENEMLFDVEEYNEIFLYTIK